MWFLKKKSMAVLPWDKLPFFSIIQFLSAQQLFKVWFIFRRCLVYGMLPECFSTVEGEITVESVLSGVHFYRCHDYVELLATVHLLPEFIKKHPKVNILTITVNVEDDVHYNWRYKKWKCSPKYMYIRETCSFCGSDSLYSKWSIWLRTWN